MGGCLLAVSFGFIDISIEFVFEEGFSDLGIFPLYFSFVVFVGLLSQLFVLGVVEILLFELFCLFLHGGHFLRSDCDIQLLFNLHEKGVFVIHILSPQFLQFFDLEVLLVIFFSELIDGGSKLPLEGHQLLLEIFRNDDLVGLFLQVVPMELPNTLYLPTTHHIWHAVALIIDLPHH